MDYQRWGRNDVNYFLTHENEVLQATVQHLVLTATTLLIAIIIALPVGFLLARKGKAATGVIAFLNVLYSIPSMAMFVLLIPLFGLGFTPAVTALVIYSQFVLVRNIVVGFRRNDPAILEAGAAMGMTHLQLFMKIELPLALPVILGGVRIACISIIGIATIASWINAGGLGTLLFAGLYQDNTGEIVTGTVFVSCLAIVCNQLIYWLETIASRHAQGVHN
jgi:osmoprotectant transport system permease protein